MPRSLIIFDFDGTLSDSLPGIFTAMNACLSDFSMPDVPDRILRKFLGDGLAELIKRTVSYSLSGENRRCSSPDLERNFLNRYKELYREKCMDGTRIYEGIPHLLKSLSSKEMAVISNKTEDMTRLMLDQYELSSYFKYIIGGDTIDRKKPDPAVFNHLKSNYPEIDNNRCCMIGDSVVDIRFAKNAQIKSISCTWGYGDTEELKSEAPDHIFSHPDDMKDILLHC